MLQPNPTSRTFAFNLPNDFFIDSICNKYSKMLKNIGGTFTDIKTLINESIQQVGLPGFSFEPTENKSQSNALNSYVLSPPNASLYEILDTKELSITFRLGDGYLNYYCLLEHFLYKFMSNRHVGDGFDIDNKDKDAKQVYCNIPLTLFMLNGWPLFTCTYLNCIFCGIDRLDLSYTQQVNEFRDFKIVFRFTGIDCDLNVPKIVGNAKTI